MNKIGPLNSAKLISTVRTIAENQSPCGHVTIFNRKEWMSSWRWMKRGVGRTMKHTHNLCIAVSSKREDRFEEIVHAT